MFIRSKTNETYFNKYQVCQKKQRYCYETEVWINVDLGSLATLDFLGYSEPFIYKWSNGENTIEQTYTTDDFVSWNEFVEIRNEYFVPSEPKDFVYYNIEEEKSLAVLTLTECDYNQTYIDCVKDTQTQRTTACSYRNSNTTTLQATTLQATNTARRVCSIWATLKLT